MVSGDEMAGRWAKDFPVTEIMEFFEKNVCVQ
jgi:hypothetical protein